MSENETEAKILELWQRCQDEADARYSAEAPLGAFSDVRIGVQDAWIEREAVLMLARRLRGIGGEEMGIVIGEPFRVEYGNFASGEPEEPVKIPGESQADEPETPEIPAE